MDVQIASDGFTLPSVRYLSNYAPKPSDQVWLLNDGADLLGVGMIAGADRTLAPVAYRTTPLTVIKDVNTYISFEADDSDGWNCWVIGDPTKLNRSCNWALHCNRLCFMGRTKQRICGGIY
jgi:hypothetical protein